jgi:hypothetical protein
LSYSTQLSATEFRRQFRAIAEDYRRSYGPTLEAARTAFLEPKSYNDALEAHARVYRIDRILRALRWNIVSHADGEITNLIPELQIDPREGKRRFLDYFGYERNVDRPLLVVEAKRLKEPIPIDIGGSTDSMSAAIAGWLRNHLDAPHPWNEWMLALREYMQDVFHRLGAFPKRAAITNGNWLVVFANPENAFGLDGSREAAYVHVFANPDQIDERYEGVYKLLAQRQVAERADEIEPGHLPGMISADKVESLTHGLRLYYAPTRTARQEAPVISVLPLILLKSTDNAWVRVAHTGDAILLPDKYENLAAHLNEVHQIARQLLDRVNDLVGRALAPTSIDAHYSDRAAFEGMRGIQELEGDPNHYVVVTGSMTHFLRAEPQIQDCRYHDIALVREDRLGGNLPAVFARSTLNPRAFFVSKEAHHCAHPDVHGMRSAPVTEENANRAGQRSWGEGSAFCEIAPFEQFLCCRTCCFESVCTKSEMLRLPCRLVQIEESA